MEAVRDKWNCVTQKVRGKFEEVICSCPNKRKNVRLQVEYEDWSYVDRRMYQLCGMPQPGDKDILVGIVPIEYETQVPKPTKIGETIQKTPTKVKEGATATVIIVFICIIGLWYFLFKGQRA